MTVISNTLLTKKDTNNFKSDILKSFFLDEDSRELDMTEVTSTLRVTLGTKKKLDSINNTKQSYDKLICSLIEKQIGLENQVKELKQFVKNSHINLETSQYLRLTKNYDFKHFKIAYSTNKFSSSLDEDFQFKLLINSIRYKGEEVNMKRVFYEIGCQLYHNKVESVKHEKNLTIKGEMYLYFKLLTHILYTVFNISIKISIQSSTNPQYWLYKFKKMNLPQNIITKDIIEKVEEFELEIEEVNKNGN